MPQPTRWHFLARKREGRGHTLLSLAAAIGRDVSVVSRYEAGLIRPRPNTFVLLAKELRCDVEDLIATAPKSPRHAPVRPTELAS